MAQVLEGVFVHGNDQGRLDYTPAGAVANGEILRNGASGVGSAIICTTVGGIAAGAKGSMASKGVFRVLKANSVVTFALGAPVWWDVSANLAVAVGTGEAGVDFLLGECVDQAAAATDDGVYVNLNEFNITTLNIDTT